MKLTMHLHMGVVDGQRVFSYAYPTKDELDAGIVEMAQIRWREHPDHGTSHQVYDMPTDLDAAEEFIEFDEPDLDRFTEEVSVTMPLEMLVVRDPDADTEVDLWLNGEPTTVDRAVDVDPGRGYTREDWEDSKQFFSQDRNLSEAFARAVVAAYDAYADNEYVDDSGWGRGIEDVELPPMKEGSDA